MQVPAVPQASMPVSDALHLVVDRALSVGYGLLYDTIFDRFAPYRALRHEVLELVRAAVPATVAPRDVRVLEVGCGAGNFTFALAEAGFSAVGVDPFEPLVELGREKRRARRVPNVAFQRVDLAARHAFVAGGFDQVVSIHSLYAHPRPQQVIDEMYRILKPGGHAVFVNHARRSSLWATWREVRQRDGVRAALGCLLWTLPNAVFETFRRQVGPHYWQEDEFGGRVREAGFTVLETRRTFLNDGSVLLWARKDAA